MGKVVPIDREHPTAKSEWRIRDLKMQIAHNMAFDADLSGNQHKVASILLFALIDGDTGWCYEDEQLAKIANVSLATLRKAIRSSPSFQKYFDVVPGTRTGRATEYRLTQEAMQLAASRRSGDLGLLDRANGESTLSWPETAANQRLPLVAEITTREAADGKYCGETMQKTPPVGGKNCPPTPEEEPMKKPTCAAATAPQTSDLPDDFIDRFFAVYPRAGDREKTEAALKRAGLPGRCDLRRHYLLGQGLRRRTERQPLALHRLF